MKQLFLLPALIAGLALIPAGGVMSQTFTILHSFTAAHGNASNDPTNSDGASPLAELILSGNKLYGTAASDGPFGSGALFALNINGTSFTTLYSFSAFGTYPVETNNPFLTNSDGAFPYAGLVLSGNTLYGTTTLAGSEGGGTLFKVNIDGTRFTTLHSFMDLPYSGINSDGGRPCAGLILSGNTLYGTAPFGGPFGAGTLFAVNTDGTGFTTLHGFTYGSYDSSLGLNTNADGSVPYAGLLLSGDTLYGTASSGGSSGNGTVFAVTTNGAAFTLLHTFTAMDTNIFYTNSDGAAPYAGLTLSGTTLYGTATGGGSSGNGTVFAINADGTGFTNLHSFTYGSDGSAPSARLILSGNTLYGTAQYGGSYDNGTVFAVNTDGTSFTTLHTFTAFGFSNTNSDGGYPVAGLILSGNTLYGTAQFGGPVGAGTVFSLFIPPRLTIIRSGANAILTWPTNAASFTLQSTTNLVPPLFWSNVSPEPSFVSGQYGVTNPLSGTQKFYRLSQ